MRPPSHTSHAPRSRQREQAAENLTESPESEIEDRQQLEEEREDQDRKHQDHSGTGKEDKIGSHHAGDSPGSSHVGTVGSKKTRSTAKEVVWSPRDLARTASNSAKAFFTCTRLLETGELRILQEHKGRAVCASRRAIRTPQASLARKLPAKDTRPERARMKSRFAYRRSGGIVRL